MNLIHLGTTKNEFGLYEIKILIERKQYSYKLDSEYVVRKFEYFYKKGWSGKALNLLKGFKK
jgi:hypothetical protein